MSISTRHRRVAPRIRSRRPRRARNTSVFLVVWLLAVGVALAAGVVGASGGVATEASSGAVRVKSERVTACPDKPAKCKPKGPSKGVGTGPTNIGGAIAETLAKMATEQLGGFVLSQLGLPELLDPNTKRFDELQTQLDGIRDQIVTLQRSSNQISSELTEIEANQFIVPLDGYVTRVKSWYDDYFQPMITELEEYVAADRAAVETGETCAENEKCTKARDLFFGFKKKFLDNSPAYLDTNEQLHRLLMPGSAGGSATRAYGELLMRGRDSTGFLTAVDSDRMFKFYNYVAEYEALASLMKAEYNADNFKDAPNLFAAFVDKQITGFQKEEADALPARIPPGVVISLPVNTSDRLTTLNRPMWIWDWAGRMLTGQVSDPVPPRIWDPGQPPTQTGSVPAALTTMNTTSAGGGFHDWHVPSRADFAGLFAGQSTRFPKDKAGDFLDRILPQPPDITSWGLYRFAKLGLNVWTSDASASSGDATCALSSSDRVPISGYSHTAFSYGTELTGDPTKITLRYMPALVTPLTLQPVTVTPPGGMTRDQRIQWCRDEVARQVREMPPYLRVDTAMLVATRSTGTQKFMP